MAKAICLVSGGMDSCVSAAIARSRGLELAFLHISYGQLTQQRELRAFNELADFLEVTRRLVVDIDHLSRIGGSALTDLEISVPEGDLKRPGIPATYVPFRNANLLAIAVSWAEVLRAGSIYIGAVESDSSGYPDCRASFFRAFNRMIREGTKPETSIEVVTPLIEMNKRQIVELGISLKAPLHLTWSCYRNQEKACGRCDSCLLRLRGFSEAAVADPIPYAVGPVR